MLFLYIKSGYGKNFNYKFQEVLNMKKSLKKFICAALGTLMVMSAP